MCRVDTVFYGSPIVAALKINLTANGCRVRHAQGQHDGATADSLNCQVDRGLAMAGANDTILNCDAPTASMAAAGSEWIFYVPTVLTELAPSAVVRLLSARV